MNNELPFEERYAFILNESIKNINIHSFESAHDEIRNSIISIMDYIDIEEWRKYYSQEIEYSIIDFYKENGLLTEKYKNKLGIMVYGFSDRGKKFIELGSYESLLEWEQEQIARDKRNKELEDTLLYNNVSITKNHKYWNVLLPLIAITISIVSLFVKNDTPILINSLSEQELKLQMHKHLDSLLKDKTYLKSILYTDTSIKK